MLTSIALTLAGFLLLFLGAELLVRGGAGLALRLGMSALVVGLTVVAYGTSAPELLVSLRAATRGEPGIALGNVIGSNIFNIAVILGLAAVVKPIGADAGVIRRDGPVLLGVSLLAALMLRDGTVSRIDGALLLAGSLGYTVWIVRAARAASSSDDAPARPGRILPQLAWLALGLGLLVLGSRLLVDHGAALARHWGVSDAVIGLTIIAAGTSMPELATSVVAALRGQSDLSLGNVVGSNLFNLLFVLGLSACIHPIDATAITAVDLTAMLLLAAVLLPILWTGRRISRTEGGLLLGSYGVYLWALWPKG